MDGKIQVAVAHPINPYLNFAASADWVLAASGDALYLLPRDAVTVRALKSVDPSRRVAAIEFEASPEHRLAEGEVGAALLRATLNRGGLTSAAQLLGLSARLVEQSVQYTQDRSQFGRPVGANQAVKHLLADVAVQLEYARPVIARAAYTVGVSPERADFAVSHAKLAATRWPRWPHDRLYKCTGRWGTPGRVMCRSLPSAFGRLPTSGVTKASIKTASTSGCCSPMRCWGLNSLSGAGHWLPGNDAEA